MSKELADIQDLKSAFLSHCKTLGCEGNYIKVCENKFEDIETAIKNYEKILFHFDIYPKVLNTETKLEALQIIGKKGVNIYFLKETDNADEYNELIQPHFGMKRLTQEEFDLLKEVLK